MEIVNYRSRHSYPTSASGIEIPVVLSLGAARSVRVLAKIDSGAAFCIFQRQFAETLGIEIESGISQTISTATGTFRAYGHSVTISCFEYQFESVVYFAEHYEFNRNVLGLNGWLDRVRFGLIHHDGEFLLSLYDD